MKKCIAGLLLFLFVICNALAADLNYGRLTGVNWFGFETSSFTPHGLWSRDYKSMLKQIKDLGFNCLRLPWCNSMLSKSPNGIQINEYGVDAYTGIMGMNTDLAGLTSLQVMDKILAECQRLNIKVILDNHSRESDGYMNETLWYTASCPEAQWISDWVMIVNRYKGNPVVVAADLDNEPHGNMATGMKPPATWGYDQAGYTNTDWRRAAVKCGQAVLAANPDIMIIIEGVEEYKGATYWWGGNLKGVKDYPITEIPANRLIYSPHEYGPEVYPQSWFTASDFPSNMPAIWDDNFWFIYKQNLAPLFFGEFGIKEDSAANPSSTSYKWFTSFMAYVGSKSSWTFWCINPNSGDTGGILKDDWVSVNTAKYNLIKPYLAGSAGPTSTPMNTSTPTTVTTAPRTNTPTPIATATSAPTFVGKPVPGLIEAENYDAMSGIQTEATSDSGGGMNVGWIETGDWMDYNVAIASTGTYTVEYRVAALSASGTIDFRLDGASKAATTLPVTGGWQTWTSVTTNVSLSSGSHVIRLYANAGGFNINWFRLTTGTVTSSPTASPTNTSTPTATATSTPIFVGKPVPGLIEAENYDAMSGIQTEATSDSGGGNNVGWIETGDWMDYNVAIASTGTFTVEYRVAALSAQGAIDFRLDGASKAATTLPATGGWQTWSSVTANVGLSSGSHVIRLYANAGGFNINWFRLTTGTLTSTPTSTPTATPTNSPTPTATLTPVGKPVPGLIEAESYDSMSGIQTEATSDSGGGSNVGWIETGDWMDYNVAIASSGTYAVEYRVAAFSASGAIDFRLDGASKAATTLPVTGGWQTWTSVTANVSLSSGSHTIRLYANAGGFNINWFRLSIGGVTLPPTVPPTPTPTTQSGTGIVSTYGNLKVQNAKLCDKNGNPVQLKGMSTHGIHWFSYSAGTINNLVSQYNVSLVRAAMYVDEGGYLTDPSGVKAKLKTVVDAAIGKDVYVIIDWHVLNPGDPNAHTAESKAFFQEMAGTYGSKANVIWEICNEPNGVTWATVKNYATQVIPVIRAIDPDNIIVVGTPTWSQDVDAAANDPITGYANIMYALHFYSGTHTQWLRDKANTAMSKGLALFVTEWGTSDASGNGGPFLAEAQTWIDWMASNKVSWANWSLCNKAESSAFLSSGAGMDGPWTDAQLSDSGRFVKTKF